MQAMKMRAVARRIVRFSRDRKAHLYYAACVCLLVVAAGLRFHDLPEKSLRHDEAVTANVSRGALSEVVPGTRYSNSNPILYPLVLYAVQKVESTPFSVRIVPATASVLTIALMLFLLQRLGVARGAAFLAALLATLSVEAIWHAQDGREYSIDALLAVLMIAGLLRYLRDGRKALLCVSLFLAPLLQYGLVLFGAAVIGAALVAPRVSGQDRRSAYPGRIGDWLKRRLDLVAPCGFFLAGSTVSYLVTVRHQWGQPDFATDAYLSPYYYQGKFDAHSIFEVFEFSIDRIWSLLTYHLPDVVAIAALAAFAILLVAAFLGKFRGSPHDGAIAVLFSFCIAVSVGAAVLGIYPLGGTRQVIYLGPIVFLAVGLAFQWTAGRLSSLVRRVWTRPVLLVAMAGAMVLAGVGAMRQDSPYQTRENIDPALAVNIESVLAVLKERVREEDMVYADWGAVPAMRFYQGNEERPANYHYGNSGWCWRSSKSCLREMADLAHWSGIVDGRIWFVGPLLPDMSGLSVEQVVFGPHDVYLIEDAAALINRHATDAVRDLAAILTRKPSIRSTFDVHLTEDMLIYVNKEPCGAEDVPETFFLHVVPAGENDLPDHRKQYGFDNLDFRFDDRGGRWFRSAERCVALRELPDYAIARIRTGQFLVNDDGSTEHLWEGEIRVDE